MTVTHETRSHAPMPSGRVLVLDDEADVCRSIEDLLTFGGCAVEATTRADDALARIPVYQPDVLVTDVRLPDTSGFLVMETAHRIDPRLAVVMVTGHSTVEDAVRALHAGATDYLAKPLEPERLLATVAQAIDQRRLARGEGCAPGAHAPPGLPGDLVGRSAPMRALFDRISMVAPTAATVLLTGETGTGKERIAEAIHRASPRAAHPFVAVHCAALAETLLESELFGHEKGAFTGAYARREGRFKLADGGTIFLDEIGELSPSVQVKLLRVLQERQFERVGGGETLSVDVRIIAATHRDLRAMVNSGAFRADLFYRLDVLELEVPPLRARKSDIPLLTDGILARLCREQGRPRPTVTPDAMRLLLSHSWPGNVRELENVLERALVFSAGGAVTPAVLAVVPATTTAAGVPHVPGATFAEVERYTILTTYEACGRNVMRTAEVLALSPRTIHYRLREYNGQPGRRRISGTHHGRGNEGGGGVVG